MEKNINMAAAVLLIFSQLKRATEALLVSPRPDQIPSQLKMTTSFVRQTFQRFIPDVLEVI
jgi:hypothetical protein